MTERRRGLLTDTERAVLLGQQEVSDNHYYTIISRIRSKIRELEEDMEALNEHDELSDELQDAVCNNDG